MDRRQRKTRDAIFRAFSLLLKTQRYEHITVQDIIDTADIGRSTFYAHFETKDMLLKEMCCDIFQHIFADSEICTFSEDKKDLESRLAHILWHLQEIKGDICGILRSQSGDILIRYLKENLNQLFEIYLEDFSVNVPNDFLLNYLVGGFCETIKWWVTQEMKQSPKSVAKYFISVIETH